MPGGVCNAKVFALASFGQIGGRGVRGSHDVPAASSPRPAAPGRGRQTARRLAIGFVLPNDRPAGARAHIAPVGIAPAGAGHAASSRAAAAGATTATFTVTTPTVATRVNVTITASYAGVERTASLTVTLPTPRASFTVTSPSRGADVCELINGGRQLDCRLDGRGSSGVIVRWSWVLTVQERILTQRADGIFAEIDSDCRLVNGANSSADSDDQRYVNMTIALEVTDRDGTQSSPTTRTVRLYTNGNCGF